MTLAPLSPPQRVHVDVVADDEADVATLSVRQEVLLVDGRALDDVRPPRGAVVVDVVNTFCSESAVALTCGLTARWRMSLQISAPRRWCVSSRSQVR